MTTAQLDRPRSRRRQTDAQREQAEARKQEIELAAGNVNKDAPDVAEFLRRWSGRYSESNLLRLWVQCPTATCLHKFPTWQGMGRQVRKGSKAILLMQPRTSLDPDKVTAANPDGKVFHGASWMALFDYAHTDLIGDFTDDAPDADPDLVAECKRLRMEAANLHPDRGGTPEQFMAAWKRYEDARARLQD
jgi:hypothetical protein